MMNLLIKLLLITNLCFSCTSMKNTNEVNCIENKKFKDEFFLKINKVEKYMLGVGDWKEFKQGLEFISKYTNVSYDKMLNYSNSYTSQEDFNMDKERWLEWYENNKCSDIQFK